MLFVEKQFLFVIWIYDLFLRLLGLFIIKRFDLLAYNIFYLNCCNNIFCYPNVELLNPQLDALTSINSI